MIQYTRDEDVDMDLDKEIRTLLCACFGQDTAFRERRYAQEPPAHRWLLRTENGELIGHVAAHEKIVPVEARSLSVLGIAEACTHPNYRRRGCLQEILREAHHWALSQGYQYSLLFGHRQFYSSSGYRAILNLWDETGTENYGDVMIAKLGDSEWPDGGQCRLRGLRF